MAQPNIRNHSTSQATRGSQEIDAAEKRAEAAEHRVEELEQRIEALENSPLPTATDRTPSPPASEVDDSDALTALRQEPMMDHLLNALAGGQDIGHYGRLVFAMVAHHFLPENDMIEWLTRDRDFSQEQAQALLRQVESRDYNPPRRERILEWQSQQEFPILPNVDDPDCGNVYRNLKFPQSVYEHIQDYQEEKIKA
jgi:hypothetical protein